MQHPLLGIHHVTAIAGDPQRNLDFYTHIMGMRFVKLTVNFDDPGSYHFYFGDSVASPGSLLTFFPHPGGSAGVRGAGQATTVSFSVPPGSLDAWMNYLAHHAIDFDILPELFGERRVGIDDPDGLRLELVEVPSTGAGQSYGNIDHEHAIRAIHSVRIEASSLEAATRFYTDRMGFERVGDQDGIRRLKVGAGWVDVIENPNRGRVAVGSVHHVAFRTADDAGQAMWRERALALHLATSPVMERDYFRSIYFREPNGVLFEVATDGPGMDIDEPMDALGTTLRLPAMYESDRAHIERRLPPLVLPGGSR